jgi:hypothetical protein
MLAGKTRGSRLYPTESWRDQARQSFDRPVLAGLRDLPRNTAADNYNVKIAFSHRDQTLFARIPTKSRLYESLGFWQTCARKPAFNWRRQPRRLRLSKMLKYALVVAARLCNSLEFALGDNSVLHRSRNAHHCPMTTKRHLLCLCRPAERIVWLGVSRANPESPRF